MFVCCFGKGCVYVICVVVLFFKGGTAMRGGAWSIRALSPVLLPRLFYDARACPARLRGSLRFLSTDSPSAALPHHARVVICGGGIVGTSVAYHLAKLGWTEIVLLEQGR